MTTFRNPAGIHEPVASYSHQAVVTPARLLITSGQIGMRPDGTIPEDPIDQLRVAFKNLQSNLEAAGMAVEDLVKLTIFLVGEWEPLARRAAISDLLGRHRPTMSVIFVAGLGDARMLVEVEAIAAEAKPEVRPRVLKRRAALRTPSTRNGRWRTDRFTPRRIRKQPIAAFGR